MPRLAVAAPGRRTDPSPPPPLLVVVDATVGFSRPPGRDCSHASGLYAPAEVER